MLLWAGLSTNSRPSSAGPSVAEGGSPWMRLIATDADGDIVEFPASDYPWHGVRVTRTYHQSGPCRLEFRMGCRQHEKPIPDRAAIWLLDEDAGRNWSNPVFEGHVDSILPTATWEVQYTCYSADKRASAEAGVMSVPWAMSGDTPVDGTGAVPALIFNVKEENDEEIAWSVDNDATVQTIVQRILEDAAPILRSLLAAPADGSTPFDAADLATATFEPQTKVAFTNETVPPAIVRTLQLDPRFRSLIEFGEPNRRWRFHDVTASPELTIVLNDFTDKSVLSINLNISTDRRYSATKIYGPRKAVNYDFKVSTSRLSKLWSGTNDATFEASGPDAVGVGNAGRLWQITEAGKRNLASKLPSDGLVPYDGGFGVTLRITRNPTFMATWDGGTTWEVVHGALIDNRLGTVTVPNAVYRWTDGGTPTEFQLPDDVWLLAAYYDTPLSVRYPLSGYGGTMYTVMGAAIENKIFDPGLAVGWENGVPVAEATRTAQFQTLAQRVHEAISDIAYSGGFVVDGIDYDFWELNQRINFAGVDGDGDPLTTGWESIAAQQTECELDYDEQTTSVVLNSDQLQYLKSDPEQLKEELKIEARQFNRDYGPMITLSVNGVKSSFYLGSADDRNEMGQNDGKYAQDLAGAKYDANMYDGGGHEPFKDLQGVTGGQPQGPQAWGGHFDPHNPGQRPSRPSAGSQGGTPAPSSGSAFRGPPFVMPVADASSQAVGASEATVFDNPLA